jgi:transcriptional regulator with XRE-family HTH domain
MAEFAISHGKLVVYFCKYSSKSGEIINKSQQGYSHIEEGRAELKIEDLIKLCDFYNVSADYFIGRSEKRK